MWPPSSPPYQPVIWLRSRFGTPACTRSNGFSSVADLLRRVLRPPDLGARNPLERLLHLREAVVDDRLVAVEREAHRSSVRSRARAPCWSITSSGIGSSPWYQGARFEITDAMRDRVPDLRHVLDRPVEHQAAQGVDDRAEVVVAPDPQPERHVALGLRHQPDAHLRDDAEVRLHEELVERSGRGRACRRATSGCPASRPCPVRITSPFASTTSMPHYAAMSCANGR